VENVVAGKKHLTIFSSMVWRCSRYTDKKWYRLCTLEFQGDFGILDSGRTDIDTKDWYGHKLDSKLLELLKKY